MGEIEYPIVVNVNNVGSIYLPENNGYKITCHIDMRYHFVREFIQDGIFKIEFVRSENNQDDGFTKKSIQ